MVTLYGIKNCDTVKKARSWLEQHAVAYRFHDYRIDGITHEQLLYFAARVDWQLLLNRSSTSWRQLTSAQQSELTQAKALELMLALPTLIKRPILVTDDHVIIGFSVKTGGYPVELFHTVTADDF